MDTKVGIHLSLFESIDSYKVGRDGGEPGSDWQALSTFLSPWKLAATSLEMRFSLKQLDTSLGREATRAKAMAYLNRLTSVVLRQGISSEQGDFVAEMLKDVSVAIAGKVNHRMSDTRTLLIIPCSLSMLGFNEFMKSSPNLGSQMLKTQVL